MLYLTLWLPLLLGLHQQALLDHKQGRYRDAESRFLRELAIHPGFAPALDGLSAVCFEMKRYAKARAFSERALSVREKGGGRESLGVAATLGNLATIDTVLGRYDDVERSYRRVLSIKEKALGPHHPALVITLNNLGAFYADRKLYSQAEPLYRRALAIDPDSGMVLHNLAELYFAQGRYAEAEPLYRRTVEVTERTLGPAHPKLAASMLTYARLLRTTKRKAEAARLEQAAKTILAGRPEGLVVDVRALLRQGLVERP